MAVREILTYPDPQLREVAHPVVNFDAPEVKQLVQDLADTMYAAPGVGLAATQVGVALRVAVTDTDWREEGGQKSLKVWINPQFVRMEGKLSFEEGCLSVPDVYEFVDRANAVTLVWYDIEGQVHQADFEGYPAVALQHEFDHLDGKLFIDKLSLLKQKLIKTRLKKRKKLGYK